MRICLLTPALPPRQVGGIGAYVEVLARGLGARGHAVDVVGCDLSPRPGIEQRSWGRVISLDVAAHPLGGSAATEVEGCFWTYGPRIPGLALLGPYVAARRTAAAALLLRQFVLRCSRRYDVFEYSNWPGQAAFLPARAAGAWAVRLSTSVVDTAGSQVLLAMERRSVLRAQVVITHSEAMNRKGQELYGYEANRGVVIHLGLPDRLPAAGPAEGPLTLISLGRAEDRKGTDVLLAALARVLPEFPHVKFRFIGSFLPQYLSERPNAQADWNRLRAKCGERVEDAGQLSEKDKDMAIDTAHWLLAPSRFESFGLMAVEAMRAGTPVVYASEGGLAEVGAIGPHNLGVPGGDADALVKAIRTVCAAGPASALAARPATRRSYEEHLRDDTMVEATLAVYRRLIADRRVG